MLTVTGHCQNPQCTVIFLDYEYSVKILFYISYFYSPSIDLYRYGISHTIVYKKVCKAFVITQLANLY